MTTRLAEAEEARRLRIHKLGLPPSESARRLKMPVQTYVAWCKKRGLPTRGVMGAPAGNVARTSSGLRRVTDGMRVLVTTRKASGTILATHEHYACVELDNGHVVECHYDYVEPLEVKA